MTDMEKWQKKVLANPGAAERVSTIEEEFRLALALTALREQAGLTQRQLAERLGVSQPRVAAIERSRNVTLDVLEGYVTALGATLEIAVVSGHKRTSLLTGPKRLNPQVKPAGKSRAKSANQTRATA